MSKPRMAHGGDGDVGGEDEFAAGAGPGPVRGRSQSASCGIAPKCRADQQGDGGEPAGGRRSRRCVRARRQGTRHFRQALKKRDADDFDVAQQPRHQRGGPRPVPRPQVAGWWFKATSAIAHAPPTRQTTVSRNKRGNRFEPSMRIVRKKVLGRRSRSTITSIHAPGPGRLAHNGPVRTAGVGVGDGLAALGAVARDRQAAERVAAGLAEQCIALVARRGAARRGEESAMKWKMAARERW